MGLNFFYLFFILNDDCIFHRYYFSVTQLIDESVTNRILTDIKNSVIIFFLCYLYLYGATQIISFINT